MPLYNYPPQSSYQDPREYKGNEVRDFLQKLGMIESSGGVDTNHPVMEQGIHKDTSAVGEYGLMPVTAQELDKSYNINELQGLNPQLAQQVLTAYPDLQDRIASTFASKLLKNNTPEEAIYKWNAGQNSQPTSEDIANSPRVKKFKVLKSNDKS